MTQRFPPMLCTAFVQETGASSTNSGLLFEPGRVSDSPRHIQQEPFGLQITQQTAVNAQQSVATAEELSTQSQAMLETVATFKLSEGSFCEAGASRSGRYLL